MKTIKLIEAKRSRKPFISQDKKYELKGESTTKYKILNDLGKYSWENKSDFFNYIHEVKHGFEFDFNVAKLFCTPVLVFMFDDGEIELAFAFICFSITLRYKKKQKL